MSVAPTEGFQLDFLRKLQRLFNEGQFVATYKFALLNAIADLAVECDDDLDGGLLAVNALPIPCRAEHQLRVGLHLWDPLESTCRHASLSIL